MLSNHQSGFKLNFSPNKGYFGDAVIDGDEARYLASIKELESVLKLSTTRDKDMSLLSVNDYTKALSNCRASVYYQAIKTKLSTNPPQFIYHTEMLYYACVTDDFEKLNLDILQDLTEHHKNDDVGPNLKVLTNACAWRTATSPTVKIALQDSLKKAFSRRAKLLTPYFLNLENINLEAIDLRHAYTLTCINLNGANLSKAQLGNMSYLSLQKANLSEARFVLDDEEHRLSYCHAENANLQSMLGRKLSWSHSYFNQANFSNADLTVNHFAVILNEANMTHARLINVSDRPGGHSFMQYVILHGATLDNILLTDSAMTHGLSLFSYHDFFSDESLTQALDDWYDTYLQGMHYNPLLKDRPDFVSGYITAFQMLAAKSIKKYLLSEEVEYRHNQEEILTIFDAAITHPLFQPVSNFSYYANSIYARFNQTFFGLLPRNYSTYHLPYQTPAINLLEKARDGMVCQLSNSEMNRVR